MINVINAYYVLRSIEHHLLTSAAICTGQMTYLPPALATSIELQGIWIPWTQNTSVEHVYTKLYGMFLIKKTVVVEWTLTAGSNITKSTCRTFTAAKQDLTLKKKQFSYDLFAGKLHFH